MPYQYKTVPALRNQGTFGKVFKGHHDQNPNIPVTIKTAEKNPKAKEIIEFDSTKMKTDMSKLKELDHQNIVKFLTYQERAKHETSDYTVYLVLEHCNAGSLGWFLVEEENRTVKETTLVTITHQLAKAFEYLHDKKIVHGNFTPVNLRVGYAPLLRRLYQSIIACSVPI